MCRAWRETFVSCSSLWTNLRWGRSEKTLTYLERSKASPVNVSVYRYDQLSLQDPFLQAIPRITGQLESLSIYAILQYLINVAPYLSNPEPLLESLNIDIELLGRDRERASLPPILAEDLSSLHDLRLWGVRTELPWRNMVVLILVGFTPAGISLYRATSQLPRRRSPYPRSRTHARNSNLRWSRWLIGIIGESEENDR